MAALFGGMSLLSAGSIAWAYMGPYAATEVSPLDYFNLVWAGVSMLLTFVAFLVCFELPRQETSFSMQVPTRVQRGSSTSDAMLTNLSLDRATVKFSTTAAAAEDDAPWTVELPSVGRVPAIARCETGGSTELNLVLTTEQRQRLLVFLFSQPIPGIAASANMAGALQGLFRRAFLAS